jgi:Fe2+ or Zn2+ uptake regulation protein
VTTADLDSQLITALRARGARVTLARLLVHRHVRGGETHVTAEQIQAALPTLSPATVYSTLDLLAELGFVRRLSTPAGVAVYDPRTQPHHHMICRSCGRMEDLDAEVEAGAAVRAATAAGFAVEHGELQLSGLCADCAASALSGPRT